MRSSFATLRHRRNQRIPCCAGVTVAALLLCGCAAQGPPHPPRVEKPEKITDLAAFQIGRTIELTFTLPTLATDGEGLSKPLEIQLFRAMMPQGQQAPPGLSQSQAWVTFLPGDLRRYQRGAKIVYPDHLPQQEYLQWSGASFTFGAAGLTRGFRGRPVVADLSNRVTITLLDVSPPVEGPHGETTEHALELNWSPVVSSLSGQPLHDLAGYRVYRSDTVNGPFALRGETPVASFRDPSFSFDRSYFYKIRALFRSGSQSAESDDSPPCVITPRDIFPPAAPSGLSAISTAAGVELIWNANTEPDLAGYDVYRREGEGGRQKLNSELVGTPLYRDAAVEAGRPYTYWITAVDTAGNESAPSAVVVVDVH